ncbi:MAG: OpgC domain-containing protein, partial [Pseudomonadota bacterium]
MNARERTEGASAPQPAASPASPAPGKRPRDLRLDFFRGLAMFIILLAHTPGNTWTLWIPARFGFSDATEIFVFCSGMASAMAFGTVYLKRSWFLGTARIVFRIWQVYWCHIGVILVTALLFVILQGTGLGEEGRNYTEWYPIA